MKKFLLKIWWIVIYAKRFRVYYPKMDRSSILLGYQEARSLANAFAGKIIVDYNVK